MKQWWLTAILFAAPALAQQLANSVNPTPPAARTLAPQHSGYAFEEPSVLVQQLLFGRAHGLSLLVGACGKGIDGGAAATAAYAKWHERQIYAVAKMSHDLALWYFKHDAPDASDADIVSALRLPSTLDPGLSKRDLAAACLSVPEMLSGERYDLSGLIKKTKTMHDSPIGKSQ